MRVAVRNELDKGGSRNAEVKTVVGCQEIMTNDERAKDENAWQERLDAPPMGGEGYLFQKGLAQLALLAFLQESSGNMRAFSRVPKSANGTLETECGSRLRQDRNGASFGYKALGGKGIRMIDWIK